MTDDVGGEVVFWMERVRLRIGSADWAEDASAWSWAPLVLIGLFASALVAWATQPYGIGVKSDSVAYVEAARNLASGVGLGRLTPDGVFKPLSHFPPLYPALLAGFERLGFGAFDAARWLSAFLTGSNVTLAGGIVLGITGSTVFATALAGALLVSPAFFQSHLYAMSDPLGLAFFLSTILSLGRWMKERTFGWLLLSALLASLAFLTRYAGVAAPILLGLAMLTGKVSPARRLGRACVVGLAATAPTVLWEARVSALSGSPTNRTFAFHPPTSLTMEKLWATLGSWIHAYPGWNLEVLAFAGAALMAVMFVVAAGRKTRADGAAPDSPRPYLRWLSAALGGLYLVVVTVALVIFDATIPLDSRILLPIFVMLVILGAEAVYRLWSRMTARQAVVLLASAAVWLTLAVVWQWMILGTGQLAMTSRLYGLGYANKAFDSSNLVAQIRDLPGGATVFTDNLESLYYFSDRTGFLFPISYDNVRQSTRSDYDDQIAFVKKRIRSGSVVFVFFRPRAGLEAFIQSEFPQMELTCRCGDGLLYTESMKG